MMTVLFVLEVLSLIVGTLIIVALLIGWKIVGAKICLWLVRQEAFLDNIPEGYATAYESGGEGRSGASKSGGGGKFQSLACSYKEFGAVKAPGDLDWAIRRIGDTDPWPKKDDRGVVLKKEDGTIQTEEHTYVADDFYWDRRPWLIKKIFGEETGIVWMGLWPAVKPKYYELRLNNFRTVRPSEEEKKRKNAEVREYFVGEENSKGVRQLAGFLVSWNEPTNRVLLSDDIYPFPVDGVRIGTQIESGGGQKKQAVTANILLFIRARIREPYLYLYRVQDALEIIQNESIQLIRQLCAGLSIIEVFSLKATLEAEKAGQENLILRQNNFKNYFRLRYGFESKGASFGYVDVTGAAGVALSAPYIAAQNAEAEALRGEGEGNAEASRLEKEGEAFQNVVGKIGLEGALALRNADVGEKFATGGKASTVVLGLQEILGSLTGKTIATTGKKEVAKNVSPSESQQPKQ
jgi:hypothetical protein